MKFALEDLHAVTLSNFEFRENRCSISDASLKGVNEILPRIFCVIHLIWIKFGTRDAYLLSDIQFIKNRPSEKHTLLSGVIEFLFIDSTSIARFG